ncbi:hypothetical protein [Sinomonas atrocyanea]|uniref:hypothetical protein n=1 Tax=Sinomonas atrocyanea TaxID=37927 RepID=UPI00286135E7|nr:hypothetical protein [Sinomonas atrocyanea]MDR6623050.1 hypothetical protein [Sinomonas atrocyanea]
MRPAGARALEYEWDRGKPTATPGIALRSGDKIIAHMGYDAARKLADKINDICDQYEQEAAK